MQDPERESLPEGITDGQAAKRASRFLTSALGLLNKVLPWVIGRDKLLVKIVDWVILFGLGRTYLARFKYFEEHNSLARVNAWRKEQQSEWDRLSTALGLLATMHAAVLALSGDPIPQKASAMWMGGAMLSVCGLFAVHYLPIKAFSMNDEDIQKLPKVEKNEFMAPMLLIIVITFPVVSAGWSAILFVAGFLDYIFENETPSKHFALVPASVGIAAVVLTITVVERIAHIMAKRREEEKRALRAKPTDSNGHKLGDIQATESRCSCRCYLQNDSLLTGVGNRGNNLEDSLNPLSQSIPLRAGPANPTSVADMPSQAEETPTTTESRREDDGQHTNPAAIHPAAFGNDGDTGGKKIC